MLGLFRLLALYIPFLLVLFLDTWLLLLHSVGIISIFDILLYQLRVDDFAQSGGTCCFHGANLFTSIILSSVLVTYGSLAVDLTAAAGRVNGLRV